MEARKRMLPPVFWAIICLGGGVGGVSLLCVSVWSEGA